MAKGKMTSPHHPASMSTGSSYQTKECSALLVLFTSRSAHVNTKVSEAPDLSFKKLLHFTEHTLLLPSQAHVTGGRRGKRQQVSKHFIGKQDPILISEAPGLQTV